MPNPASAATGRYLKRLAVLMALYMIAVFGVGWTFRTIQPEGPLAFALAVVPALPVIGVFWAVMRLLVEETDEYIRFLFVRQCLFATGFCLAVVTVWQWLQNYEVLPPGNGGFGAAFFWFVGLGLGAVFNRVTEGHWGQRE
ncbi:MAG: hypothetical protein QNI87_07370 [Erythrobacter sp.]|uniref:hypothetical protein n=1 Tax=Erythrobacter sp. TaxID=1042 RepID=UPI00260D1AAC|nr:hypothetical protein [Erythrobacter sp.]MDJ0978340.1 hypothetical protein [Erythrobacter sp.]